ncbi:MAG: ABC transporter ATP-binding protein [Candidatus Thermoplasmatota archaeon]
MATSKPQRVARFPEGFFCEAKKGLVDVNALSKEFDGKKILKNVNLNLRKGEFAIIYGKNGAGKTTFIKLLSTLYSPTSGKVEISGYDTLANPIEVRKRIGVVTHDIGLYDELTLKENLLFFCKMKFVPDLKKKIEHWIEKMGLENKNFSFLSSGEKQRAAIIMAVLHEPDVLLLDDVYAELDEYGKKLMNDIIKDYIRNGKTVLLTTHDKNFDIDIDSRKFILENGKIKEGKY